jgi:nitrite reductase (NADH) small subunit/3-phenylpropionate/trans-cinnamate dioxygenase ferredoxin subunit
MIVFYGQSHEAGMAEFVTVGKVTDVPLGTAKAFPIGQKTVAIFHQPDGSWAAIDDYCPHMGASLAEGAIEDGIVECPWHAWRFRVTDGTWVNSPKLKVACYEVRAEGDDLQVKV